MLPEFSLYPSPQKLRIETEQRLPYNADCAACSLRKTARLCLQGEVFADSAGEETLLVVGEGPTRDDNEEGRPFVGRAGARLRPLLRTFWKGRIVLDNSTRCYAGRGESKQEVTEKHIDTCRPYLASTLDEVRPTRVVALGASAIYALLGRSISPLNSRRGYTWLWNDGKPVPVFYLASPASTHGNRFLVKFFEEDLSWALTAQVPQPKHLFPDFQARAVSTVEEAEYACRELAKGEGFAFDLEWAGFKWHNDFRILSLAAAPLGRSAVWVWDEEAINDALLWAPMEALLKNPDVPKGGSNVKVDMHALQWGKKLQVQGVTFDTRLVRKLLEPDATANLDDMAELVGMGGHKAEAEAALGQIEKRIVQWAENSKKARTSKQTGFDFVHAVDAAARMGFNMEKYASDPRAVAYAFLEPGLRRRYVARDALTTARLASRFSLQLERSPERWGIWEKVVLPGSKAIQRVEAWGVPFDTQACELFRQLMQQGLDSAYEKVQQYRPEKDTELNPGSPQQLSRVLYDKLGLTPPSKTDSGAPSTDEDALLALKASSGHPLPGYILEYRHYQKLVGYASDWALRVCPDGRIRPSIHLDGARSGRSSCSEPNLQNIPRAADSEDGKRARDCFAAPPGHLLLQLDYSQLELRIASLLSGDVAMADLFRSGMDFHEGTAKLISTLAWGIPPEQVTKVHRTGAKAFNFGIAYGKTDKSLAADLGIDVERAVQIRKAIFGAFVDYGRWCREAISFAKQHGGSWTYWEGERARWRPLWQIAHEAEDDAWAASKAKNGSINTPIQGTASDFCVASITKLVDMVDRKEIDAEVVLPIHDSIMLVCRKEVWKDVASAAKHAMEDYPWATKHVPLVVDVEVGEQWGSLEKEKA